MAADVYETKKAVAVEMSVLGIKTQEIDINVLGETLTVCREMKTEEERKDEKRNYYQKQLR